LKGEILAVVWDLNLAALSIVKMGALKAGKLVISTDGIMVELKEN
jgi:hypothetical protein